jgi:thymidine kinase
MAELTFNYGAMGCGKTRELLKILYSRREDGFSVAIMKPEIDKKAGKKISSRDTSEEKVDFLIKSKDNIYLEISKYLVKNNLDYLLVDEAQFLESHHIDELSDVVDILGISVICYGLKTDFKGELFKGSKRLLEISDNIIEIERRCSCGRKKIYNMRIVNDNPVFNGDVVMIDGVDASYEAKCRYCYKNAIKEYNKNSIKKQNVIESCDLNE